MRHGVAMNVEVLNLQHVIGIDRRPLVRLGRYLMKRAHYLDKTLSWSTLAVSVADDARISAANSAMLGHDRPTDVIAVRYSTFPGDTEGPAGEIMINAERAVEQARRIGWSPDRELALYLAHGCDHLHGQDDSTRPHQTRMRRRELRWLRDADASGLITPIVRLRPRKRNQ